MTKHQPISVDQDSQQDVAAKWMAVCRCLEDAVRISADLPDAKRILGEALCGALETVCAGGPEYTAFGDMRDDAEWWADLATPMELEIYAGAALKRITRATFAERAKKRLFLALWNGFSEKDRAAFLAKIQGGER